MPRNRLSNMAIDEISLVDRAANQHATVAIAKRDGEHDMPNLVYEDGTPFDESDIPELELGTPLFYEDNLTEVPDFKISDSEPDDGGQYESFEYEPEGELVGKSAWSDGAKDGVKALGRSVKGAATRNPFATGAAIGGTAAAGGATADYKSGKSRAMAGKPVRAGRTAYNTLGYRNGQRSMGMSKRDEPSLGQQVYEELSKAYTGDAANSVVSKVADLVGQQEAQIAQLTGAVEALVEKSDLAHFSKAADDYGLPIDPDDLGGLLQRLHYAGVDPRDMEALGEILGQAGTMSKAFTEIGEDGGYASGSVLDEVAGYARSLVGKADVNLSTEGAMTELFAANPDAYESYLAGN